MGLLANIYKLVHRKEISNGKEIPYYWNYSLLTIIAKPIRKWFSAIVIPSIPFNSVRIWCYRRCGYKIGKKVFIGMRCYLDDLCYDKIIIGDNVTISYGVYFACHGLKQGHNKIEIGNGSYIGMRTTIIARTDIKLGENTIIGACTLVNKSIPADSTVVGVPCRIIRNNRFQ